MSTSHSKSVSWHFTTHDQIPNTPPPKSIEERFDTPDTLKHKGRHHTPSLSIPNLSKFQESNSGNTSPTSPSKRFKSRAKINPAPIVTTHSQETSPFKFPHAHNKRLSLSESSVNSDSSDNIFSVTSPKSSDESSTTSVSSPYILNSQPDLQDIFITLANKERKVLEAKEQLLIAESDLSHFKGRWNSVLSVSQQAPLSPTRDTSHHRSQSLFAFSLSSSFNSNSSNGSQRDIKRAIPARHSSGGSVTGLGINSIQYSQDGNEEEDLYRQLFKQASEIDATDSDRPSYIADFNDIDPESDLKFYNFVKSIVSPFIPKRTIKSILTSFRPIVKCQPQQQSNQKDKTEEKKVRPHYPSITKTYYDHVKSFGRSNGVSYPSLSYVHRYVDSIS
jgi:hypothetical protein